MTAVLLILIGLALVVAAAAVVAGRRLAPRTGATASLRASGAAPPLRAPSPSRAAALQREADQLVSRARHDALAAREAVREEVGARTEAVEARAALLEERERNFRDRRAVFDDRRHLHRKRREEIDARLAAVSVASAEAAGTVSRLAGIDREEAVAAVLARVENELEAEHPARVEAAVAESVDDAEPAARERILEAMERQQAGHADGAPRASALSLEGLDEHGRERLLSALSVISADTGMELGVDEERLAATLRGMDPVGREVARQAALEVVDRKLQAADVPPLLLATRGGLTRRLRDLGEQALWEMQMSGRPELAELVGTLHYRFSYGQNALLHCEETGHLCGVLAAELGMSQEVAREAGMLHDIGKAVDHDVEGSHAIIGGEMLRVLGSDAGIVHAVKAHHFDEEPTTDLAMLTICADAISASRPGARRDTLTTYLARLEQLQSIATRQQGVERAFPLQAGREVRVFVRAKQVKDAQVPELSATIARDIEKEMQYPGVIKVTVIRETAAVATAPAQIAAVMETNRRRDAAAAAAPPLEEHAELEGDEVAASEADAERDSLSSLRAVLDAASAETVQPDEEVGDRVRDGDDADDLDDGYDEDEDEEGDEGDDEEGDEDEDDEAGDERPHGGDEARVGPDVAGWT
ncbi:MAG: Rnase Y domain-containing protein [Candidatus Dormibacteria bacterium]